MPARRQNRKNNRFLLQPTVGQQRYSKIPDNAYPKTLESLLTHKNNLYSRQEKEKKRDFRPVSNNPIYVKSSHRRNDLQLYTLTNTDTSLATQSL